MVLSFSNIYWQYHLAISILHIFQSYSGHCLTRDEAKYELQSYLMIPLINSFSFLLSIIPITIGYFRTKNQLSNEDLKSSTTIEPLFRVGIMKYKNELTLKTPNFFYFILLGTINTCPCLIYFVYTWDQSISSLQIFINICLTLVLCYIFLKRKFFRHHYFALALFAVNIAIYCSITYKNFIGFFMSFKFILPWLLGIGLLLFIISSSFREVLEKHLIKTYDVSASVLLFHEGWVSLVLFILFGIGMNLFQCKDEKGFCVKYQWEVIQKDFISCFNFQTWQTMYIFIYFLSTFALNLLRIVINKRQTPTHRYVSEMISQFYWFWINLIQNLITNETKSPTWEVVGKFIHVVFLLFACLVFNEYIIIKLWRLDEYTYNQIGNRGKSENEMNALEEISYHNQ